MPQDELTYTLSATSSATQEGAVTTGTNTFEFGVTKTRDLPSPAELLIGAFAACCLKNVERFSEFMKFEYTHAEISVSATRQSLPPMISTISFNLVVYSDDAKINTDLLMRNLAKFGTIYNTLAVVCTIEGEIRFSSRD